MTQTITKNKRTKFFIANNCNPQTIEVCKVRAAPINIEVIVGDPFTASLNAEYMGIMLPYPATDGIVHDYTKIVEAAKVDHMLVLIVGDSLSIHVTNVNAWFECLA